MGWSAIRSYPDHDKGIENVGEVGLNVRKYERLTLQRSMTVNIYLKI